jgi:hypothetical protein
MMSSRHWRPDRQWWEVVCWHAVREGMVVLGVSQWLGGEGGVLSEGVDGKEVIK